MRGGGRARSRPRWVLRAAAQIDTHDVAVPGGIVSSFTAAVGGGAAALHGAVSIQHDATAQSVAAVGAVVAAARAANYTLVSMDDCVYGAWRAPAAVAARCVCVCLWRVHYIA